MNVYKKYVLVRAKMRNINRLRVSSIKKKYEKSKNICTCQNIVVPLQRQFLHTMIKRFFSLMSLLVVMATASAGTTLDSLLNVLEMEVARSFVYTERRQAYIDSLCAIRPITPELELQIAKEYQHFQSDSSLAWYLKLRDADEPIHTEAFINIVKLLESSGHFSDAIALINSEESACIHNSEGYKMAWLLFRDASENTPLPSVRLQQERLAQHYYDLMMKALERSADSSEEDYLWLQLYRASDRNDWKNAIHYSEQLLARVTPADHLYAILAYGHATLYEQAGNMAKHDEWLVRSAITDVRCGITDNGSSWIVAQTCFEAGDLQRAYAFSDYSLTNATFFNAPTRFIQNFTPGHLIANRYEYERHQDSIRMIIVLMLLAFALLTTVVGALYGWHQNRKLKMLNEQLVALNHQLKEADKVKEQYICRYLEVYSDYIRRLTTMARKAGEKDPASFMDREMDNFYRSFDDTFLSLYGTFVEDFNALLKPEARLIPKPGERMTIEMRIFALILLGITSSAKIAELLCYSPNTISNYRVKMKNAALGHRDTFEQRVQQIGEV